MNTLTLWGLLALAAISGGVFAFSGEWVCAALMCVGAGVVYHNIEIRRSRDAAIAQKGNGSDL